MSSAMHLQVYELLKLRVTHPAALLLRLHDLPIERRTLLPATCTWTRRRHKMIDGRSTTGKSAEAVGALVGLNKRMQQTPFVMAEANMSRQAHIRPEPLHTTLSPDSEPIAFERCVLVVPFAFLLLCLGRPRRRPAWGRDTLRPLRRPQTRDVDPLEGLRDCASDEALYGVPRPDLRPLVRRLLRRQHTKICQTLLCPRSHVPFSDS